MITATAVSGLIESSALIDSQSKIKDFLFSRTGNLLSYTLGKTPLPTRESEKTKAVTKLINKTLGTHSLDHALDESIRDIKTTMQRNEDGDIISPKKITPQGIGSGNVFDAGAEWITAISREQFKQTLKSSTNESMNKSSRSPTKERIVDGLKIPKDLNSTNAVNFVLTQKEGKLKPKDLKAAILKNR
jgi:hypothetical protein